MRFRACGMILHFVAAVAAQDLGAVLSRYPSLSKFNSLLRQFDLLERLCSLSHITVLAPTNQAIQRLEDFGFDFNAVDPIVVQALFTYHVLNGTYADSSLTKVPQFVPTLLHPPLVTNVTGGAVAKAYVEGDDAVFQSGLQMAARSIEADIPFTGGLIHTIDSTLIFPHNISVTAAVAGLTSFLDAADAAAMVDTIETLSDATILIPTNKAFEDIGCEGALESKKELVTILRHHIIPSTVAYSPYLSSSHYPTLQGTNLTIATRENGSIFINDAQIVTPDLLTYGGVAHVIDKVLLPEHDAPLLAKVQHICDTSITSGRKSNSSSQIGAIAASSGFFAFIVQRLELAAISAVFLLAIAASSFVLLRCNKRIVGHLQNLKAFRRQGMSEKDCEDQPSMGRVECLETYCTVNGRGKV